MWTKEMVIDFRKKHCSVLPQHQLDYSGDSQEHKVSGGAHQPHLDHYHLHLLQELPPHSHSAQRHHRDRADQLYYVLIMSSSHIPSKLEETRVNNAMASFLCLIPDHTVAHS